MHLALDGLPIRPEYILIDGNKFKTQHTLIDPYTWVDLERLLHFDRLEIDPYTLIDLDISLHFDRLR